MCQKKSDDESRVSKDESRFKKKVQGFQGNEEENVTETLTNTPLPLDRPKHIAELTWTVFW